jgi:transcriptional regulator GlxA family with amidase domain
MTSDLPRILSVALRIGLHKWEKKEYRWDMASQSTARPRTIGFILLPGFSLMSYASATEPLRASNILAGKKVYERVALSVDGRPAHSSAGATIPCLPISKYPPGLQTVFVCAAGGPADWNYPTVHKVLRKMAVEGIRLGGISGGPYVLAAAGLLEDRDFTIHWEHAPALAEAFPHLAPRQARFVVDGNRITCGGGVAPLDMMHALIAEHMGLHFARRVSDWYLHTNVSEPGAPQVASTAERYATNHPALVAILEKMESSIDRPINRTAMAAFAQISVRHLDWLFAKHLGQGFRDTYHLMRLRHANQLLKQSPLSVSEIAFATGYCSAAHFSNAYRKRYGHTPRQERR